MKVGWVYRKGDEPKGHCCPLPVINHYSRQPDGDVGDLWRCDDCGLLWSIYINLYGSKRWGLAGWWQRRKARMIERGLA